MPNHTLDERLRKTIETHYKKILIAFFFLMTLAMKLRYILDFGHASVDYAAIQNWFDTIKQNGGILGLGSLTVSHGVAYKLLFALLSYLPVSPLYAIYGMNLVFEILLAYICGRFVRDFAPANRKGVKDHWQLVSLCVLILPNLVMSTLIYGQNDSIYLFFVILSGYLLKKEKPIKASICYAVAVLFKSPALMLLPFVFLLWLDRKLSVRHLGIMLVTFLVGSLPNLIVSGSLYNTFYSLMYGSGPTADISNVFNFYALFLYLDIQIEYLRYYGIALTFLFLAVSILYAHQRHLGKRSGYVGIALLFILYTTYFLPGMRGRYDLLACLFAILYCLVEGNPRDYHIPIVVNLYSALMSVQRLNDYTFGSVDPSNYIFVVLSIAYMAYILYLPNRLFTASGKRIEQG